MKKIFNTVVAPLFLMTATPPFVMLMTYTNIYLGGSFSKLWQVIQQNGLLSVLNEAWFSRFFGTGEAWAIIAVFMALQLLMIKILPGKPYHGNITPMGNLPYYPNNGLLSYIISIALFFIGSLGLNLFSPDIFYVHLLDILASLNVFALVFCLFLYFKGRFYPSFTDNSTSGNFIFDYYWGTELHPRIFGIDVKLFTNSRFGMTAWSLFSISYIFAQKNIYGAAEYSIIVSVTLLAIYLFKFFIWEAGYMRSMDIAVDRAGYYICWGCLVWVPGFYNSPFMFMVNNPVKLPWWLALLIFVVGMVAIWTNYWADKQRQEVREKNGDCNVWGKPPVLIKAKYTTGDGKEKENLLLASGFWGISRHFHYIPELSAAFLWSCATGFDFIMPFCYFLFLTILLFHRSLRDEEKCSAKYGTYWTEYKKAVPYKIIPYVF